MAASVATLIQGGYLASAHRTLSLAPEGISSAHPDVDNAFKWRDPQKAYELLQKGLSPVKRELIFWKINEPTPRRVQSRLMVKEI